MASPFEDLPVDILREIVDFAALDLHCALNLTLVASHVYSWTLPTLYHTVRLGSSRSVNSFLAALLPSRTRSPKLIPFTPVHCRVKNLAVFGLSDVQSILDIFTLCTEVESIACGFAVQQLLRVTSPSHSFHSHARQLHLIGMACRDGIPFSMIPMNTTHLHVQLSPDTFTSAETAHHNLPDLTHFTVSAPITTFKTLGLVQPVIESILLNGVDVHALRLQVMGTQSEGLKEELEAWYRSLPDKRLSVSNVGPLSRQWCETLGSGAWGATT